MLVVLAILAIVLSLLLVVGLHEAGHALAARIFGVKIKRISIGFGKPLLRWHRKRGECEWVWSLWPLGGYVQLLNTRIEPVGAEKNRYCFDKKPIWMRIVILLSGAAVNLIIAWLALTVILAIGYQQSAPLIISVTPASIAQQAGLAAGGRIMMVAGQNTPSWREVGSQLIMTLGKSSVPIVVKNKEGIERQTSLDLKQWKYKRQNNALLAGIGINPEVTVREQVAGLPLPSAGYQALLQISNLLVFFLVMLKQLVTGVLPFAVLLGPLGMFTAMISSFTQGLVMFLSFIANMSVAVALINLFPLPGLDGGSIVYASIEKIRGKPVSVDVEVLLHRLIFIIFCVFLAQLLVNDLQRYLH